jgi:protein-S-isoprenylcysteine O-methyltransferase Ste14
MAEALIGFFTAAGAILAALMLATFPAALLFWLLIHPFAPFWRRRGPRVAYTVVSTLCLGLAFWIYQYRHEMLAARWPFRWWLAVLGMLLYFVALWLEVECRRHLALRTLVGAPELGKDPGRVLSGGIYGRLRHPRYLAILLGVGAWALVLNYPAIWVLAFAVLPGLYVVILLEERELKDRFGDEYEEYMKAVPNRLLPRLGGNS